jgi:hypothetical protein
MLGTMVKPTNEDDDLDIDLVCQLEGKNPDWTQNDVKQKVGDRLKAHDLCEELLDDEGRRCWTLLYRKSSQNQNEKYLMDVLPVGLEFSQLGWKSARTIFVKVLLPELKKLGFREAQNLVLIIEEFVWSFALIQGETPDDIFEELKFWDVFKQYQITFEVEKVHKALPPKSEFIRWVSRAYSVEEAGRDLAVRFGLIADQTQWIAFFSNHPSKITVIPGQLKLLVAVLYQLEMKDFVDKRMTQNFCVCWTRAVKAN